MTYVDPKLNQEPCPNGGCGSHDNGNPFRRYVITAEMGTDEAGQPFAPENGTYQNALVKYEATGNTYIYSSDGIYTQLDDFMNYYPVGAVYTTTNAAVPSHFTGTWEEIDITALGIADLHMFKRTA